MVRTTRVFGKAVSAPKLVAHSSSFEPFRTTSTEVRDLFLHCFKYSSDNTLDVRMCS